MVAHLSTLKKGRLMSKGAAYLLLAFLAAATFVHASTELDTDASIKDADTLPALPVIPPLGGPDTSPGVLSGDHDFTLRHVFHHGTYKHPRLHRRIDIHPESQVWTAMDEDDTPVPATPLHARSTSTSVQRLVDRRRTTIESLLTDARMSGTATVLSPSAWTIDDIRGPNVTDKETVLSFAKMAANAYVQEPHTGEWEDVGGGYNYTEDFGWEGDGLRGHIFADTANSTVVIGLKGTTPAVFDGAETTTNDKVNDNLFCSCCCAQGGQYLWKQVCDCYSTTYTCNSTCLTRALKSENRYYQAALELYSNVTELYPNSDVWLAGHSLGGAVSSLLGLTYGLPVVTFEAFGEALAASRLGLPSPPSSIPGRPQTRKLTGAYHFGHTADPIYMGTCNGATSGCTLGGYAMESVCHTGSECIYDVVEDKGWRPGIGNHRIRVVISQVIEAYDHVPECKPDYLCVDCANWKFFESNGSETTTSRTSTASSTSTRTSTCKTPGWWGCLDESTTTGMTTSTSATTTTTETTTTTTCETPGWFGCKDSTSTTRSSSITKTTEVFTTTTTALAPTLTSPPTLPTSSPTSSSTQTCTSKEWFGLICVDPSPVTTTASSSPTASGGDHGRRKEDCLRRGWLGTCLKWRESGDQDWKDEI